MEIRTDAKSWMISPRPNRLREWTVGRGIPRLGGRFVRNIQANESEENLRPLGLERGMIVEDEFLIVVQTEKSLRKC